MSPFKPILFLEPHPRIRSLFESFWGLSMIANPFIDFSSEEDFWESGIEEGALLIVDCRLLQTEITEWTQKIQRQKPLLESQIIWVVETKEERDRLLTLGLQNVLRLPFQWGQWLPMICKRGLRWRLWKE